MPRSSRLHARHLLGWLLAVTLVAALAVAPAAATETEAVEGFGSDNMAFVTNLEFDQSRYPEAFYAGTDLDFATLEVPRQVPGKGDRRRSGAGGPTEQRDFAFVGTALNGLQVVDITDRERPQVVAVYDCAVSQADVFVFERADLGRTYAAYSLDGAAQNDPESQCHRDNRAYGAQDARGHEIPIFAGTTKRGTFIIDVTDPYEPRSVSFLPMRKGTHQVTVHPSGRYVYNSAAVVITARPGSIEVYDITDPTEPRLTKELELLTGLDSHDLTFNADGTRAYSAALTHSFVIDTTDPADPVIIGRIYDPTINIHHDAHKVTVDTPLGERDYMLIGDELAGAAGNAYCPGGGVHVYDITGDLERAPVKVGAFFMPEARPAGLGGETGDELACTAHVLQIHPDEQIIVMAWYNGGVRVLDYSGLADLGPVGVSAGAAGTTLTPGIQEIGHYRMEDSVLWSAKVPEIEDDGSFYVYGGDIDRHLDVFRFHADGEPSTDGGSWYTADAVPATTTTSSGGAVCLLNR